MFSNISCLNIEIVQCPACHQPFISKKLLQASEFRLHVTYTQWTCILIHQLLIKIKVLQPYSSKFKVKTFQRPFQGKDDECSMWNTYSEVLHEVMIQICLGGLVPCDSLCFEARHPIQQTAEERENPTFKHSTFSC